MQLQGSRKLGTTYHITLLFALALDEATLTNALDGQAIIFSFDCSNNFLALEPLISAIRMSTVTFLQGRIPVFPFFQQMKLHS